MSSGWSSNSDYSLSGALGALAHSISYEVRLAFIWLSFVVLVCRYNLAYFYFFFKFICRLFFFLFLFRLFRLFLVWHLYNIL
jgi:NADH-ubiquinone oxidoreductase chain 1